MTPCTVGSSVHGFFPGKNTGVGGHFYRSLPDPGLLHCRHIPYYLSHQRTHIESGGVIGELRSALQRIQASLVAQMVKHLPTMRETWVRSLGWEDPLEKETATHSSIHTWKIPWTEEPGQLQSMGSQRVGHDCVTSLHFAQNSGK